jgi:hypothetical protein
VDAGSGRRFGLSDKVVAYDARPIQLLFIDRVGALNAIESSAKAC